MSTIPKSESKNYGLIIPKIETHEEGVHHVLGTKERPIVQPSGDWSPYNPDREPQSKNGVETNACTVYNTLSQIERAIYFFTGIKVNYADRYVARAAAQRGILNPNVGADPHQIAELIRTVTGLLREDQDPWSDDITTKAAYYDVTGLVDLLKQGPEWWKEWTLEHDWVWTGNPSATAKRALLKDALTKGTVCVSVAAWHERNGLYYKPKGSGDNHWTGLSAIKNSRDIVFDSYDQYEKDLEPNYDYAIAKVYYLTRTTPKPFLFTRNLGYGMTDPDVVELQRALVSLNYKIPHAVTDQYLTETKNAVFRFQGDNGISDDGSHFGPRTRYALNKTLNPSLAFGGSFLTFVQSLFSGV